MAIKSWMSWEGGVDLLALTSAEMAQPNVIVHVARMVHTPVGSAPSGMILIPDGNGAPQLMGFVSSNSNVGEYFGPHIFAGTPFENAPVLQAEFEFFIDAISSASTRITVEGHVIELQLSDLGALESVDCTPGNLPFHERSLAAKAAGAKLKFDGQEISLVIPSAGMNGGPAAVYSACGIYER